jgi:hypothetical protein
VAHTPHAVIEGSGWWCVRGKTRRRSRSYSPGISVRAACGISAGNSNEAAAHPLRVLKYRRLRIKEPGGGDQRPFGEFFRRGGKAGYGDGFYQARTMPYKMRARPTAAARAGNHVARPINVLISATPGLAGS